MSVLLRSPRSAQTVYRLRPGSELDLRGEPVASWASPVRTPLKRAVLQGVTTQEEDGTRHTVTDQRTLFLPYAADLLATDRIAVGAEVWRVNGNPAVRRDGLALGVYTIVSLVRSQD